MNSKQNSSKENNKRLKNLRNREKNYSDMEESKYVKKWLQSYSESSKSRRLSILERFSKFIEKSPKELIEEHYQDQYKNGSPLEIENVAKKEIHAFFQYIIGEENKINKKKKKKGISHNSARQYAYSVIPSFYKKNNVPISFNKGEIPNHKEKGTRSKIWRNGKEIVTQKQKKIWLKKIKESFKNLRDKAILLCKISSGLDDVDLFNLKVKDFRNGAINNITYIEGNRQKNGIYFQTFFSTEATSVLELYLNERKEKRMRDLDDNNCLFSSYTTFKEKKDKTGDVYRVYRKIRDNGFSEQLSKVCEQLKLNNITPKSLRRFFNSQITGKVPFEVKERMMGHQISIPGSYAEMLNKAKEGVLEEFAEFYVEKVNPLVILGNGSKMNVRIESLRDSLEDLATENKQLKQSMQEMGKFILMLSQTFKERHGNNVSNNEDEVAVSDTEIRKFQELVEKLDLKSEK